MPSLRGVVHAATVYEDQPLASLDRGALERVWAAKAAGAWNLHTLTADLPLDMFVLFSSFSSLIGNAGQASYVAANAFLEQLGRHRRRQSLPAITIQWGALGEAGAVARDERVARHLRNLGVNGLSTSDALASLERVLDADVEQIAVVDADWQRIHSGLDPWGGRQRLEGWITDDARSAPGENGGRAHLAFETLDPDRLRSILADRLAGAAAKVMRIAVADLDRAVPLREVGMDSLLAAEIAAAAEVELGFRIPPMLIAAGPSVHDLAASLIDRRHLLAGGQPKEAS
jgi:acyl carrier protein